MTCERPCTDYMRPLLGRGGPPQQYGRKANYWILSTLKQAVAEARKAALVSLYRLHKHY